VGCSDDNDSAQVPEKEKCRSCSKAAAAARGEPPLPLALITAEISGSFLKLPPGIILEDFRVGLF